MEIIRSIVIAVFCSCIALALHLVVSLFRKGRQVTEPVIFELKRQVKLTLGIWALIFILYAYLFFVPPDWAIGLTGKLEQVEGVTGYVYGIVLYLALCFLYLSFYYFADRSVSATLLEIIEKSSEGKLTAQQIKGIYGVENKYFSELKSMLDGGFITEEAGYYKNSLKGRLYARIARAIKIIFKLGPGG